MSAKVPPLNVRLGATRFDTAPERHIDPSGLVPGSAEARAVLAVCPAGVYREVADDGAAVSGSGARRRIVADDAACLECGACLAVASGGLRWHYPSGGGVRFRQG